MCKTHWNQYTAGLARDAKTRKAADGGSAPEVAPIESEPVEAPRPIRNRGKRGSEAIAPAAGSQGDAG